MVHSPQSIVAAENATRIADGRTDLLTEPNPQSMFDNTKAMTWALQWAAQYGELVVFPEVYGTAHEVVTLGGVVKLDAERGKRGGLRLIGDPIDRVRPNIRFYESDSVWLGNMVLEGVMPDDGPAISPRDREAQPNVWLQSVGEFTACGTEFSHPRGDWLYCGVSDPQNPEPNRNVGLYGITTSRGGRAGFVLNAVDGFDLRNSKMGECGASIIDFEGSAAQGVLRDAFIVGNEFNDATGLFAHLHHDGILDQFWVVGNARAGAPVTIDCVLGSRGRGVHAIENAWDVVQSGGRMMRFWHVDKLDVLRNVGPYSRIRSRDPVDILDCTGVDESNPKMIAA